MAPPARTITVALDIIKTFDTINIHTLIIKLLQTNIPGTIIKIIANYIKGRKSYTTYINHTSKQRQFKTGVPQDGVLSSTLFNMYTSDLPPPSVPVQAMAYTDDITITSTQVQQRNTNSQIYIMFLSSKQNNLTLNPDKTTYTLFTPDPAEYKSKHPQFKSGPKNQQHGTTHGNAPKVSGPYLRSKTHIHNISVQAHTPLQMIKALTATGWGKQKETPMAPYKAVMRPALECSYSIW